MNKTFRILEIVWLVMAGIGVIMSIYCLFTADTMGSIYFTVFAGVSALMYWVRKKQRIRFEGHQKQNPMNK